MKIQTNIDTIYIACTVRSVDDGKQHYYVPIIVLNEDLKGYSILASSDLIGLQIKNSPIINQLISVGSKILYISVNVEMFKKITNTITENLNVTVNSYLAAVKEYNKIIGVMGKNPAKKDVSYHLYASILGQNPCCVITPKLELVNSEELDIIRGIGEAAQMSDIESDSAVSAMTESYPFTLEIIEDEDYFDDEEDDNDEI